MTPEVATRLKEITVDPKTVTLKKKIDSSSVTAPDLRRGAGEVPGDPRRGRTEHRDAGAGFPLIETGAWSPRADLIRTRPSAPASPPPAP